MNSIPNWNLIIQERQEQAQEEDHSHVLSMSDYRMRELLWENGEPSELGFSEMSHTRSSVFNNNNMSGTSCDDTLEYIVDQATKNGAHHHHHHLNDVDHEEILMKKRLKSSLSEDNGDEKYYERCLIGKKNKMEYDNSKEVAERSTCDTNTTMIIMETSPSVIKTKEEDSTTCHHTGSENQDEGNRTVRSHHTRSSRAAATHKQSERKRRDRINQKMKDLQKLVPNACKTDKASMLDEVIEYMKQLKAQVNFMMMNSSRNVHDHHHHHQSMLMRMMMMMPSLGMHQQLQMSSILASMATSTTSPPHHHHHNNNQYLIPFIHPNIMTSREAPPPVPVVAPPPVIDAWRANLAAAMANSLPQNEYYNRLLAQQSMNMDFYNNMRGLCTQQEAERSPKASRNQVENHIQRQL